MKPVATKQIQGEVVDEIDEDEQLLIDSGLAPAAPQQQQLMLPTVDGLPASVIENAYKATTEVLVRVYSARANKRDTQQWADAVYAMCDKPEFSERAIYNVSVGKNKAGKEVFAEGPSVYLARSMAAMYPNFEWDVIEHGITRLADGTLQAQFEVWAWDYETNSRARQLASVNLPRWARTDVQIRRAQMSAQAFVVRSVIFAKLPQDVVANAFEKARERQLIVNADLEKDKKGFLVELSEKMRVPVDKLLEYVGVEKIEKITASDIRVIKSLKNSIATGEINPADIWEGAYNKPTNKDKAESKDDSKPPEAKKAAPKPNATEHPKGATGGNAQAAAKTTTTSASATSAGSAPGAESEADERADQDDSVPPDDREPPEDDQEPAPPVESRPSLRKDRR